MPIKHKPTKKPSGKRPSGGKKPIEKPAPAKKPITAKKPTIKDAKKAKKAAKKVVKKAKKVVKNAKKAKKAAVKAVKVAHKGREEEEVSKALKKNFLPKKVLETAVLLPFAAAGDKGAMKQVKKAVAHHAANELKESMSSFGDMLNKGSAHHFNEFVKKEKASDAAKAKTHHRREEEEGLSDIVASAGKHMVAGAKHVKGMVVAPVAHTIKVAQHAAKAAAKLAKDNKGKAARRHLRL